jgi:hypothetical protein
MFSVKDKKPPRDEVAKLTATYVNSIAAGLAIVGGIAPIINAMSSSARMDATPLTVTLLSLGCLCVSAAIHVQARAFIRRELSR